MGDTGPKHSNYEKSAARGSEGDLDEGGGTGGNSLLVLFHWLIGDKPAAGAAYGRTLPKLLK